MQTICCFLSVCGAENGDDGRGEGGAEHLLKGWIRSLRELLLLAREIMDEVVTLVSHGEGTGSESLGFTEGVR